MITIEKRVAGSTLPNTVVDFTDDLVTVDLSAYTWTMEASRQTARDVILWEKTTGFTNTPTSVIISWTPQDRGALPPDNYVLELTGIGPSGIRKALLLLTIERQNGPAS